MKQKFYGLTQEQWTAVVTYLESCPFKEVSALLNSLSRVQLLDVEFQPAPPALPPAPEQPQLQISTKEETPKTENDTQNNQQP
jgi:hypothetical protein